MPRQVRGAVETRAKDDVGSKLAGRLLMRLVMGVFTGFLSEAVMGIAQIADAAQALDSIDAVHQVTFTMPHFFLFSGTCCDRCGALKRVTRCPFVVWSKLGRLSQTVTIYQAVSNVQQTVLDGLEVGKSAQRERAAPA